MTDEDPKKTLYRRFVDDIINGGKYDLIPEIFDEGYVDHSAPPGAPGGLGGVEAVFKMFRGGFPDVHFEIQTMLADGDKVATRVTGSGTNSGSFMGAPPSGKTATWGSHGIFRVANGKIAEHWGQPDIPALLTQIGAIPPAARIVLPADTSDLKPHATMSATDQRDPARLADARQLTDWLYGTALTAGDTSQATSKVAADYIDHPPARPFHVVPSGPKAVIQEAQALHSGFPDLKVAVVDVVAEGDGVCARTMWSGTNTGWFFGIPPTGKSLDVQGLDVLRVADGQLVERYGMWDLMAMLHQLGFLPPPGPPPH